MRNPNLPHVAFAVPRALVADLEWLITTRAGWQRLGLGRAQKVLGHLARHVKTA